MLEVLAKRYKKYKEDIKAMEGIGQTNLESYEDLIKLQDKLFKFIVDLMHGKKIPEIDYLSENKSFIKNYIASRGVIQYTCKKCGKNLEIDKCDKCNTNKFSEVDFNTYLKSVDDFFDTNLKFIESKLKDYHKWLEIYNQLKKAIELNSQIRDTIKNIEKR